MSLCCGRNRLCYDRSVCRAIWQWSQGICDDCWDMVLATTPQVDAAKWYYIGAKMHCCSTFYSFSSRDKGVLMNKSVRHNLKQFLLPNSRVSREGWKEFSLAAEIRASSKKPHSRLSVWRATCKPKTQQAEVCGVENAR